MLHKMMAVSCLLILVGWPCCPAARAAGRESTIRVAIPVSFNEDDVDMQAGYVGYTVEYLYEISQYTGWDYEIIPVPGSYAQALEDAVGLLLTGEADFIAPIRYIQDLSPELRFSQNSYLTDQTVLQVPDEVYDGTGLEGAVRVAALDGCGMEEAANAFFARTGVTPTYLYYASPEDQRQAVCSGSADVQLNSMLDSLPDMTQISWFSPTLLYFAGVDSALIAEVDDAIRYIRQAAPGFAGELTEKYFSGEGSAFTQEERTFLEQAQPYAVGVLRGNAPYQDVDPESGVCTGIGVDLLRYTAQQTGLEFTFVAVDSWDELLERMETGEIQMVAGMPYDYEFARARNLTISRNYVTSPYVLVSRVSFPSPGADQRLALMAVNAYQDGYYEGSVVPYDTMADCIEAVHRGEADYTYADLYTAEYFIGDPHYNALELTPQSYTSRMVCFGLSKPTSHALLSILNKTIHQIPAAQLQDILNDNISPERDLSLLHIILTYPQESILAVCVISLSLIATFIFLLWKKDRLSKVLRQRAMEDSLTRLYNAAACRKLVAHLLKQLEPGQTGGFLIMDLDSFKQVNDVHGHQTGDRVLRQFTDLLCDVLRQDSIIARIGGDEFVAYLSSIQRPESLSPICERILREARSIHVGETQITVSIGAVAARAGDDYDALYQLADAALYQAKGRQKDQYSLAQRDG